MGGGAADDAVRGTHRVPVPGAAMRPCLTPGMRERPARAPGGASRPGTARHGVAPMGERIAVNGSPHGTERARLTLQVDVQAGDERLTASHSLYFGHFSDKVNREFRKSHRVRSPEQATRPDPPG